MRASARAARKLAQAEPLAARLRTHDPMPTRHHVPPQSAQSKPRPHLGPLPGFHGGISSDEAIKMLPAYASAPQTPMNLKTLFEFGSNPTAARVMLGAQFLHRELPVRLAHRVHELETLPYGLNDMRSLRIVRRMYEKSFADVLATPRPTDAEHEQAFADLLTSMLHKHEDVVKLIARAVLELKLTSGTSSDDIHVQRFLDRFYMSRIGLRMLMAQQIAIREPRPGYVGIINSACSPSEITLDAAEAVRSLAYRHFGDAPDIVLAGQTDLAFHYVDGHLFFPMFELLKNAVRATVETHEDSPALPPVRVIIADGSEDVTIKISDEGGGIRRSGINRIWTYMFSTASIPPEELLNVKEDADNPDDDPMFAPGLALDPIAGFGYGLPLSRLYARYFGGDLTIVSMEGYGTDCYLHLCKLGNKAERLY